MVEFLLENDASLAYLQDSEGLFPVHVAAREGQISMVHLFMEKYLDSGELLDHRGRNFLHIAAGCNISSALTNQLLYGSPAFPIWEKLLTKMINATDNDGNTPLHLAVEKTCTYIMKALLNYTDTDFDLRNKKGLTPFDISVIQIKECPQYSMVVKNYIENHVQQQGANFTFSWINDIMPIINCAKGNMSDKIQIIGLGAVLITTVSFTAAFTLPGGYNSDGFPTLNNKLGFTAFLVANVLAFLASFFAVILVMYGGLVFMEDSRRNRIIFLSYEFFHVAAKSMVLAFGYGLLSVLLPLSNESKPSDDIAKQKYDFTYLGLFILGCTQLAFFIVELPKLSHPFQYMYIYIFGIRSRRLKPSFKRSIYEIMSFGVRSFGPLVPIFIVQKYGSRRVGVPDIAPAPSI